MSFGENGWEIFGGYVAAKRTKLEELAKLKKTLTDIFKGISIYIDGISDPPDYVLKDIILQNGGNFCHYYSKDKVTHIIANNLPKSKIDRLTNEKIVSPIWIMDSYSARKLLNYKDFELYSERFQSNTKMLNKFVSNKTYSSLCTSNQSMIYDDTGSISISEYFNKSRLHHLSMWRNQLQIYLDNIRNNLSGTLQSDYPARYRFQQSTDVKESMIQWKGTPLLMHVDIDCFFVAVGIRNQLHLKNKPVAVTHSRTRKDADSGFSYSEIASCSYEARKCGVKNGMLLGKAKQLCPDIIPIPYLFDEYLEVAKSLYSIVAKYTSSIQVGSCDELYIDLMDIIQTSKSIEIINPITFAEYLRTEIYQSTQCTVSCGIGSNIVAAKLATNLAKPNSVYWIKDDNADQIIGTMNVRSLPGVGYDIAEKLKMLKIETCAELQQLTLQQLMEQFGSKVSQKLYNLSRGIDKQTSIEINKQRKCISVEINYGIRMTSREQLQAFFMQVANELANRLKQTNAIGSYLCLKIMIRQADASHQTSKYLGHGHCDSYSKSMNLLNPTADPDKIAKYTLQLFDLLGKSLQDLRGVGFTMQKLQYSTDCSNRNSGKLITDYFQQNSIKSTTKPDNDVIITGVSNNSKKSTKSPITTSKSDLCQDNADHIFKVPTKPSVIKSFFNNDIFGDFAKSKLQSKIVSWLHSKEAKDEECLVIMKEISSFLQRDIKFVQQMIFLIQDNLKELYNIDVQNNNNELQNEQNVIGSSASWLRYYNRILDLIQDRSFELFGECISLERTEYDIDEIAEDIELISHGDCENLLIHNDTPVMDNNNDDDDDAEQMWEDELTDNHND